MLVGSSLPALRPKAERVHPPPEGHKRKIEGDGPG